MSPQARLAIGIGCRKAYPADAIVALVRRALAAWPDAIAMPPAQPVLCTLDHKQEEPGIRQAAESLDLPLVFLSADCLRAAEPRVQTPSAAAQARFGVSSVCEAAALAGAGPLSVLVVPRLSDGGATCAIAATLDAEEGEPE